MSIVIIATLTPEPQHLDEVKSIVLAAVPAVHAEPGCQKYAVHETPQTLVVIEQWDSHEALREHGNGEAFTSMSKAISALLATPMAVQLLQPLDAGTPTQGRLT